MDPLKSSWKLAVDTNSPVLLNNQSINHALTTKCQTSYFCLSVFMHLFCLLITSWNYWKSVWMTWPSAFWTCATFSTQVLWLWLVHQKGSHASKHTLRYRLFDSKWIITFYIMNIKLYCRTLENLNWDHNLIRTLFNEVKYLHTTELLFWNQWKFMPAVQWKHSGILFPPFLSVRAS